MAIQTVHPEGFPPARFVMSFMAFTGFINVYVIRNNINLAVIAMVNYTAIASPNATGPNNSYQCEFQNKNETATENEDGPFVWTEPIQALISTSFLWGYIITNLPGGRIAERFGTKWIFAASQALTATLTLMIPVAATVGWELVIVVRVLMGIAQGVSYPCMHPLLARWIPPQERSTVSALVYAGEQLGTVIGLLLTGLIINELGWEAVFYIEAAIAYIWVVLWLLLVYDSPDQHPRISKEEKEYIQKTLAVVTGPNSKNAPPIPWKAIATSLPFWAILIANVGHNWGFMILLTELPIYMKNILGFDIKSNSYATAFPYFITWIVSLLVSPLGDFFKQKGWLSIVWIRKLFTMMAHMGPAVCLLVVAFAGCDLTLIAVMLTLAVSLQAGFYAGWLINHIDIAPNFAGTLFGITNGVSIIPSGFGPLIVGLITEGNQTVEAWSIVFIMASTVLAFDAVFFFIFASGDEQPWNKLAVEDQPIEEARRDGIRNDSTSSSESGKNIDSKNK